MHKLDVTEYHSLSERYKCSDHFFPLIGAVLLDLQDGVVYVDDLDAPGQAYVEHAFGFAQIFGQAVAEFESDLERYLMVDKHFSAPKVRLYANYTPQFLRSSKYDKLRAIRQRFIIDSATFRDSQSMDGELKSVCIDAQSIAEIEDAFGVVSRFWRCPDDFLHRANPVVVNYGGQLAGICYAAAVAHNRAEIDVVTLPEFRGLGVGKFAVSRFVEQCFTQSLQPLWDCFTNNAGSMNLSSAIGFLAAADPYPFFTIDKNAN